MLYFRDHAFDSEERCRTKTRKSKAEDISKPDQPARGCQTIRQKYYKVDESSMLATARLGIDMDTMM